MAGWLLLLNLSLVFSHEWESGSLGQFPYFELGSECVTSLSVTDRGVGIHSVKLKNKTDKLTMDSLMILIKTSWQHDIEKVFLTFV